MKRLLICCLVACIATLTGCVSPPAGSSGAGYINGGITLGAMAKMPPLSSRGVQHLGLVMECDPTVSLQTVALTVFGNQTDKMVGSLVPDAEKRALFVEEFNRRSVVPIRDLSASQAPLLAALKFNAWNAKPSLQSSPNLDAAVGKLRAEGIDSILFIQEDWLNDFIGMTSQPLAAQGLYRRFNTIAAYGGFRVFIIDLKTLKLLPDTRYTQAVSQPFSAVTWKERHADYSAAERSAIANALKEVLRRNVQETVVMLKAVRPAP